MSIGTLSRVPLRSVWRHEASDFTTWLEENTDVLNEVLDFNLVSAEREKAAGDFSVDLVGEDEDGRTVVIENQLERSDHDHLGKVLTYLAAMDASAAVWIVARSRPEHVKAVAWLNQATDTPFYLVQVEAVRIGDSDPAPLFTLIVGPSVEARAAGEAKKNQTARHVRRKEFWTVVLDHAKTKSKLHARISPGAYSWVGTGAGVRGVSWNYGVRRHDTQVELYIDRGDAEDNAAIFEKLAASRGQIEQAFPGEIEWQRLEGKRACRIRHRVAVGGWKDEDKWQAIAEATVDAMVAFEKALAGPVRSLKNGWGEG